MAEVAKQSEEGHKLKCLQEVRRAEHESPQEASGENHGAKDYIPSKQDCAHMALRITGLVLTATLVSQKTPDTWNLR